MTKSLSTQFGPGAGPSIPTPDRVRQSYGQDSNPAAPPIMSRFRMAIICLALLLEGMSSSSINVQISAIRGDLASAGAYLELVVGAFLISYAGLLPIAGRLVDVWNRRTVFLLGVGLFGVGCLLCAGAWSIWPLVAGRFIQGAGAALSAPAALALITTGLGEGHTRNRAIALYGAMGAVGFSLGLVLPGFVVANWGWRLSFLLFVPITLLVLAATVTVRTSGTKTPQRIDALGALLLTAALMIGMHAIGGIGTLSIWWLAGEFLAVDVIIVVLILRGGVGGFPREVLRSPRVIAACMALGSVFAAVVSSMYILSLGLEVHRGADAFDVALLILPQPLCFSLLAGFGSRLVGRFGPGRILAAGATLLVVSVCHLGAVGLTVSPLIGVLPAMAGVGVSLALCFPAASIAAVNSAPECFRGTTAGLLTTAQNVGGAAGLAAIMKSVV